MSVLSGQRVLILDDNRINRLTVAEICNGAGMVTTEPDDIPVALAILQSSAANPNFDLVILDGTILGADGLELVHKIRELHPSLPILLITSGNLPGDQTKMLNLPLTEHAVKPVPRAELLRLLAKLLAQPQDAQANTSTPHRRILIADDSEDNQFLLQAYLKGEPYDITFVENGDQAVKAAETQSFDLILMDTEMPGMDGLTATKMIRSAEKKADRARVTLLALTANASLGDSQNSRAAGSDAHILKPISREEFIKTLRQFTVSAANSETEPEA
jgi:CheY-like chemotaxis protein